MLDARNVNARDAFLAHARLWNDRQFDEWQALFSEDVVFDDPVGVPTKYGRSALVTSWERSNRLGRSWRLEPRRILLCGNEAAVDLVNYGSLGDREVVVDSIEIWRVNDAGLVDAVRVFFDPDPTINDSYYLPPA